MSRTHVNMSVKSVGSVMRSQRDVEGSTPYVEKILPRDHHLCGSSNVCDAAAVSKLLMDQFLVGLPESQKNHLRKAAFSGDPVVLSTIASGVLEDAKRRASNDRKLPKIHIKYGLEAVEQEKLVKAFPEFNIVFSDRPVRHPHAFAAAHRTCSLRELVRLSGIDPRQVPKGYTHAIKFVGGNPAHHIYGGYRFCHTCMPILDVQDANRNAKFLYSLKTGAFSGVPGMQEVVRSLQNGKDLYFCHNRSQHCNYTAPVLIALHSTYDCDAKALVGMMESAHAEVLFGVMMFDASILLRDHGDVNGQKATYRKYHRDGKDMIEFLFKDDVQMHYCHELRNYLLLPTQSVFSSSKSSFFVERLNYSDGCLFFAIRRLRCGIVPKSTLTFSYPEVDDYYAVHVPQKNAGGAGRMIRKRVVVPKKLWDLAYHYALSLDEQKFRLKRIECALTSFNTRAINKGESFEQQQLTDPMDIPLIAQAIFCLVYIENYNLTQTEKTFREQCDQIRNKEFSNWKKIKNLFTKQTWRKRLGLAHDHFSFKEEVNEDGVEDCRKRHRFLESLQEMVTEKRAPKVCEMPVVFTVTEEVAAQFCDIPSDVKDLYDTVVRSTIDKVELPEQRSVKCEESLRVITVPGDGDCLLHALAATGAVAHDPSGLRRKYAELSQSEEQTKRFMAPKGTIASYLEMDDIRLISAIENIAICVHTDAGSLRVGETGNLYHIRFRGSHYDALVEEMMLPQCMFAELKFTDPLPPIEVVERDRLYSSISKSLWKKGKIPADPYSALEKGGYVSRAGLKLAEVVHRGFVTAKVPAALDLCGGPGGFAQVLLENGAGVVVGLTKRTTVEDPSDYPYDRTLFSYENFYLASGDGETDLLRIDCVEAVINEMKEMVGLFDLVVADGSVGSDDSVAIDGQKEVINVRLLEAEWKVATELLIDGGQFFVKLAEPHLPETARIVVEISKKFLSTVLLKPLTSRAAAREVYLVASGFGATSEGISIGDYFAHYRKFFEREKRNLRLLRTCALTASSRDPVEYDDPATVAVMRKVLVSKTTVITGGALNRPRYLTAPLCIDRSNTATIDVPPILADVDIHEIEKEEYDCDCDSLSSYHTAVSSTITSASYQTVNSSPIVSQKAIFRKPKKKFLKKVIGKIGKNTRMLPGKMTDVIVTTRMTPEERARLMDYTAVKVVTQSVEEVDEGVGETQGDDQKENVEEMDVTQTSSVKTSYLDYLVRAQSEYKAYLQYLIESRRQEHKVMWDTFYGSPASHRLMSLEAFEKNARVVAATEVKSKYLYCFDGTEFRRTIDMPSRDVLVSEDTKLFTDIDILQSVSIDRGHLQEFNYEFVQAGPGCGKTTYLVNESKSGDMILVSTREGKADVAARVAKSEGKSGVVVRTIHSFLMNPVNVARLLIDEALMQHAGMIAYAIQMSGCSNLVVVGDTRQIPFVNRCPDFKKMEYAYLTDVLRPSKVLSVSHRVPADVAVRFRKDYESFGFKTTNLIRESCFLHPISSVAQVPIVRGAQYLTFLQHEKEVLKGLGVEVSTVNEYQGKQSEHVIVVRLTPAQHIVKIYSERAYVLVAMTRHTRVLDYYTVHPADLMSKTILERPSMQECDAVSVVSGGGADCKVGDNCVLATEVYMPRNAVPVRSVTLTSMGNNDFVVRAPVAVKTVLSAAKRGFVIRFCSGFDVAPYLNALEQYNRAKVSWVPNSISVSTDRYLTMNTVDEHVGSAVEMESSEEVESQIFCECEADLGSLQNFVNCLFPSSSFVRNEEDTWMVETSQIRFNMPGVKIKPQKGMLFDHTYGSMVPKLCTPMPNKRPETTTEVLLALLKRNCAVPKMVLTLPVVTVAYRMVDRFFQAYLRGDPRQHFEQYSVGTFKEWLDNQPPIVGEMLEDYDVCGSLRNQYNFIIKPTPKPKLDDNAAWEYSALQTVMFQDKAINAYFCPIFKALKRAIIHCLRPNILLYTDVSPADFAEMVTAVVSPSQLGEHVSFEEMDIGKYDKSQGVLALMVECEIMRRVGVPDTVVDMWYHQHVYSMYHCYSVGVSGRVHFQRRSGDAATFLGNTLFLMAVVADSMRVEDCMLALFSGDDSLFVGEGVRDMLSENRLAAVYNLQAKRMDYASLYFCSKFLLPDVVNDRWWFCFDPVKLLVKMGRRDLRNREHVEEYRISVLDTVSSVESEAQLLLLAEAVMDRYMLNFDPVHQIRQLCSLPKNRENFHSFFEEPLDLPLLGDPSLPDLEF
nr:TPA_asm: hypothetical protein [Clonorsi virus 2]